jgi:type II restriction/modification system DNA methylase subunit YeeA
MSRKYDVVVTNPPYAGGRNLQGKLKEFLNKEYEDSKKDLCTTFIERCIDFTKKYKHTSMITMHSWMFLSSYENLRKDIINNQLIDTMLHLGTRAFPEIGGEVVQTTTFVFRNVNFKNFKGEFIKLVDYKNTEEKSTKTKEAVLNPEVDYRYTAKTEDFKKIPGGNIGYWASEKIKRIFHNKKKLGDIYPIRQGMATSDNDRFLKRWYEVNLLKSGFNFNSRESAKNSLLKWFPYNKGGGYRKWYGNNEYVVNWKNDGYEIKKYRDYKNSVLSSSMGVAGLPFIFKENITWSKIATGRLSVRYIPNGYLFDVSGCAIFDKKDKLIYTLGFLNTKILDLLISFLSQTINYEVGSIKLLPLIYNIKFKDTINSIINQNIQISKKDWDSFETSWDFEKHPLVEFKDGADTAKEAFENWSDFAKRQFNQLWKNEEELNRIFIEIYGLEDELTPDVDEKDVTVRKANKKRDIKSFISYGVGCILGRYSLDEDGLAYAGGEFDWSKYKTVIPDYDGIVTILDKDYFDNDIVKRFVEFVEKTFGHEKLEVNLEYIASVLSPRNGEQPRDTLRRYFETGSKFYKDHCQTYNKRPIYWKVSSGGRDPAFMALIYLHRYNEDTLSTLRIKYLHKLQQMLKDEKEHLRNMITKGLASSDEAKYKARISDIDSKLEELVKFDEKLGHLADQRIKLDLDDGVKENYKKLEDILDSIR